MTCPACSPLKCQASGCECVCHEEDSQIRLEKEKQEAYALEVDAIEKRLLKQARELIKDKICPICKKRMKQVRDSRSGKFTGHLFRCDCMPKNKVVSIG